MPAVVVRDHRDRHITDLGLAGEFCLLQIGHANHIHTQIAVDVRFGFRRELRPFHAEIRTAAFPDHPRFLARFLDHASQVCTNGVGKSNVRHYSVSKKCVDAMASSVEELVRDDEFERLVLFLQRTDGRDRDDAFDAELLEPMNVAPEIQFTGQNAMTASVACQKSHFAALKHAADIGVGRRPERRFEADLFRLAEARHGIKAASTDDPDFRLWQTRSRFFWVGQTRDYTGAISSPNGLPRVAFPRGPIGSAQHGTIFLMRVVLACCLLLLSGSSQGQQHAATTPVTVPAAIDHNRVIINAEVKLPNGSLQTLRAWVDNGNPDLYLSRRVATLLNLPVTCGDKGCSSPPPKEIYVGGMAISLGEVKEAKIPLRPVTAAAVMAPGLSAEMNVPASLLRNYDVLIDFPEHRFSIGAPGTIHFRGSIGKVHITDNGLIQVPSQIDNRKYNVGLDVGSCISFLSEDLVDKITTVHPDWPRVTGAIGSANMWGADAETKWKVVRVDRVQFGPLFLTDVALVALPKETLDFFEKRAGMPTVGLLGSNMLLNYRVGLDYAHSTVYFDIGRMARFPDFDVVGLVLRPEVDGQYTILGVADLNGKPSVDGVKAGDHLVAVNGITVSGSTMGQVWGLLGGTPGQGRKLTIERGGKEFIVTAEVQHFLPEVPDQDSKKKRK